MNEKQILEIEKHLGRSLTPEERRLLRYTEAKQPVLAKQPPAQPRLRVVRRSDSGQ